jgi:3-isopropylmalate/(R)-2-methylmalate dehydratase large subunit
MMGTTLAEKVWADHLVRQGQDGAPDLIYIDLQLMHEVTSPQAFEGLRLAHRRLRRTDLTIATEDHNTPTVDIDRPIADKTSALQISTLESNCKEFGVRLHALGDADQGIVHQVGPQLGLTQPGMTVVCGDSHTSTHGAFGALAFGIGTSEVEHVMATQTLSLNRSRRWPSTWRVIARRSHRQRHRAGDYRQNRHRRRARACVGIPRQGDSSAFHGSQNDHMQYVHRSRRKGRNDFSGRDHLRRPQGASHAPEGEMWDQAVEYWKTLQTDDDAVFDREVTLDASKLAPFVTWGTNPGQGLPINAEVPIPEQINDETQRRAAASAIAYMGLEPGMSIKQIPVDTVFIGSCTNGRIEDLRAAASVMKGRHKAKNIHRVLVVPASSRVRLQAESEGLDKVFEDFGAEWRNAGCSMCLGMNPDKMVPGERAISTSNRNFEGRQGKGSRTHLASPLVAAATAVRGTISSPVDL